MAQKYPTKEEHVQKIAARIRALRKAAGHTSHETFAFKNDIDRSLMGKYERGEVAPGLYALLRICLGLGITLSEFYDPFSEEIKAYLNSNK